MRKTSKLGMTFNEALVYAHEQHRFQKRNKTDIPYISHPMAVASLVLEYGGSETEAIAALLHDVLEDAGQHAGPEIVTRFGHEVLGIVAECSDVVRAQGEGKGPWAPRKERYLAGIPGKSASARLVTACDKLHNLTAIARDFHAHGEELWERFAGGRDGTRWYYENLGQVFLDLEEKPAGDMARKLGELGWSPRRYEAPDIPPPPEEPKRIH